MPTAKSWRLATKRGVSPERATLENCPAGDRRGGEKKYISACKGRGMSGVDARQRITYAGGTAGWSDRLSGGDTQAGPPVRGRTPRGGTPWEYGMLGRARGALLVAARGCVWYGAGKLSGNIACRGGSRSNGLDQKNLTAGRLRRRKAFLQHQGVEARQGGRGYGTQQLYTNK